MARAIGIGGVFFKSPNVGALHDWYEKHLGLHKDDEQGVSLYHSALPDGSFSVFGPFKSDTKYFEPSEKEFMVN